MLVALDWLALEVTNIDRTHDFYTDLLELPVDRETDDETVLAAGSSKLYLRPPGPVPRGGLHTHFAFAIPAGEYEEWWDRLESRVDLKEHVFGSAKSLYCYDPEGNCVELGQRADEGPGITGIFEVVLEVEALGRAEQFYQGLGAETIDRGTDRRRIRLDLGPVDLELWEPQIGLANARGGVHVDLGFRAEDPTRVSEAVAGTACSITTLEEGVRIKDPDGHYLTITPA